MNKLLASLAVALAFTAAPVVFAADEYSAAEHRVFVDQHMANVPKATTIDYHYAQTGAPADSFEDLVRLKVGEGAADKRTLAVEFLTGAHKIELPSVEGGSGNPVILYFLEYDIRNMHDRLGGQQAYFRKRIRLALADAATVKPVKLSYKGKAIDGNEVTIEPYANDSLKERFGQFAGKVYVFTLSNSVPGGVYEIRTSTPAAAGGAPSPAITTMIRISDGKS
ncbi:hypothetical protein [Nevskia ramosa]|uniref:hypothetical protein n=1 Tax=Nevskia ramosa TaxID=64002 RepID=UPI0003B74255|nr:hypothetical protein [Nevskia ramosa]